MKLYWKSVSAQVAAIVIAAASAALITFIQSVITQAGMCPTPEIDIAQAGTLGGIFKAAHWGIVGALTKHHV